MMQTTLFCPFQQSYSQHAVVFQPTLIQDFFCLSLCDQVPPPPTLTRKTSLKAHEVLVTVPQSSCLINTPFYPAFKPTSIMTPPPITPKCKILEQARKEEAPWMKNGKLAAFALFPEDTVLAVTDGFMNSALGKKAVDIAETFCVNEQLVIFNMQNYLKNLSRSFSKGTCLGQSYSMIIAFSKVQTTNAKKLFEVLNKTHVLFFQLSEHFSRSKDPHDDVKSPVPFIEEVQEMIMHTIEDASGWKFKGTKFVSLLKDSSDREIRDILTKINGLVEISLFYIAGSQDHSMLAFLTKDIALYDPSIGMASYLSREGLIFDIQRRANEAASRNGLYHISFTHFSET